MVNGYVRNDSAQQNAVLGVIHITRPSMENILIIRDSVIMFSLTAL